MLVLGIDTALDYCSIALWCDGECVGIKSMPAKNSQAEILPQMVKDLLVQTGHEANKIDRIAVTIGPGSFAGVRVGLAFAKGLKIAIKAQIVGISTLETMATQGANLKTIAAIKQMGSYFIAAFEGRKTIIAPSRHNDLSIIDDLPDDFVLIANFNYEKRQVIEFKAIDAFILAGLGANCNINDHPAIPQYLRAADAVLWQGSQYV